MQGKVKIGILQCDDVPSALIADHPNYPQQIARLFGEQAPDWGYEVYAAHRGQLPKHVDKCDAFITTGSRYGVNDDQAWIVELSKFVNKLYEAQVPLIGICFGHQLMAKALGGVVTDFAGGWGVGLSKNQIVKTKSWMTPADQRLDLLVSHKDQVITPPRNSEVLASSQFCQYFMLQYGDRFVSVQGHPEFSQKYCRQLMELRRSSIQEKRVEQGIRSLDRVPDRALFATWMVNFLEQNGVGQSG